MGPRQAPRTQLYLYVLSHEISPSIHSSLMWHLSRGAGHYIIT
jgi:hypothetical protein